MLALSISSILLGLAVPRFRGHVAGLTTQHGRERVRSQHLSRSQLRPHLQANRQHLPLRPTVRPAATTPRTGSCGWIVFVERRPRRAAGGRPGGAMLVRPSRPARRRDRIESSRLFVSAVRADVINGTIVFCDRRGSGACAGHHHQHRRPSASLRSRPRPSPFTLPERIAIMRRVWEDQSRPAERSSRARIQHRRDSGGLAGHGRRHRRHRRALLGSDPHPGRRAPAAAGRGACRSNG